MKHKHRVMSARQTPFSGQVAWPGNPAAHGSVTRTYTCKCGAERRVNFNGPFTEKGSWLKKDSE